MLYSKLTNPLLRHLLRDGAFITDTVQCSVIAPLSHGAKTLTFGAHCEEADEVSSQISEPQSLPTRLSTPSQSIWLEDPHPSFHQKFPDLPQGKQSPETGPVTGRVWGPVALLVPLTLKLTVLT